MRTGELKPSPMARSLGRKRAIGTRRSTRSANLCAGSTVTPESRSRMNSSMGRRARRSSEAITTVSTRSSRTAPVRLRAVTAMAGLRCGAVGKGTTAASGFSSGDRKEATFASANGPWICAGAPAGPTMSWEAGTTSAAGAKATSAPPLSRRSIRGAAAPITSAHPPAAICCGSDSSTLGSSFPATSYSP